VITKPPAKPELDALWEHSVGHWVVNCLALVAISVALAFLVQRLQRRHEPDVMQKG